MSAFSLHGQSIRSAVSYSQYQGQHHHPALVWQVQLIPPTVHAVDDEQYCEITDVITKQNSAFSWDWTTLPPPPQQMCPMASSTLLLTNTFTFKVLSILRPRVTIPRHLNSLETQLKQEANLAPPIASAMSGGNISIISGQG